MKNIFCSFFQKTAVPVVISAFAFACTVTGGKESAISLPPQTTASEESTLLLHSFEDPYIWLEEIDSAENLEWVKKRNLKTSNLLENQPGFKELHEGILKIYDSDERIPHVYKMGDYLYNFWVDEKNPRGLWRRTVLEEYRKDNPEWEILLDIDVLSDEEEESWVWRGASCLFPVYEHCIISLSRGGADATVHREFNLSSLSFIGNGFNLPEAKGGITWIDEDTVYVFTDFGENSLTDSGFPRTARRWKRNTPVEEAEIVYEGLSSDTSVTAWHDPTPGFERSFVRRGINFFSSERYLINDDGELVNIDTPPDASLRLFRNHLTLRLREAWKTDENTYPEGALIVIDFDKFMEGNRNFDLLFEPTENTAFLGLSFTLDHIILNILEDVQNRIFVYTHDAEEGWIIAPLGDLPEYESLRISAADPRASNEYFLTSTGFLSPTTLFYGRVGSAPEKLKSLPAFFDSENLEVNQHFATSKDGTRIPYFQVSAKNLAADRNNPVLLTAYGGFEISRLPSYGAVNGKYWLSKGGVYVLANIRGGGEYGPGWHQAAIQANRHRAFEDFAAVAKDLMERGITRPEKLGIRGGSNGGLLMGNMIVSYPELFGAIVSTMPLLDMKRYHLLFSGASWIAEYGDPDNPEHWKFIQTFSPYHNVSKEASYPPVLLMTSTRDDRVHPAHARKMTALMESYGHEVYYYENIEGGHRGSVGNTDAAYVQALIYTFLKKHLFAEITEN